MNIANRLYAIMIAHLIGVITASERLWYLDFYMTLSCYEAGHRKLAALLWNGQALPPGWRKNGKKTMRC